MSRKPCKACKQRGWHHEESCAVVGAKRRGVLSFMEIECNCQRLTCDNCLGSGYASRHKDRS